MSLRGRIPAILLLCALPAALARLGSAQSVSALPRIITHDNTRPAGKLANGVLNLQLELRRGEWYPESEDGPHIGVDAFSEADQEPSIPGPMIRVPEGTQIHASVHNALPTPIVLHGLQSHPGKDQPTTLAPGERREFDFPAGAPGTYYYWAGPPGTTMGGVSQRWDGDSSQLSGAFIVDERGKQLADRVFVIGFWRQIENLQRDTLREFATINGKSWPYTERLQYRMGEKIRWRWINASGGIHPMHMHGSYYGIEATGNGATEVRYSPDARPMVVTHLMEPGSTMDATWSPSHPGHWLFHCHIMAHLSFENSLSALQHREPGKDHAHSMVGLVMAVDVSGETTTKPAGYRIPRRLTLFIEEKRSTPLEIKLRVQDGPKVAATSQLVGPPIVLHRGEPTEITVVNRLSEPTAIHWHGIELESYYDGVPGMTGMGNQLTPLILPGATFVARMTPPRAGTFIYHTHWRDVEQLRGGLNGPLIVVDGNDYHPELDQSFVAAFGVDEEKPLIVNGTSEPPAINWKAGRRYHLRLVNIAPNAPVIFTLFLAGEAVKWQVVSKDGMALPPAQRAVRTATQIIAVGETYDFEAEIPHAGDLVLRAEVVQPPIPVKANVVELPIHVR